MINIPARKADVPRNYHDRNSHDQPTLNVKYYGRVEYTPEKVAAEFQCDEAAAERVAEWCYESAREDFWERALDCLNFAMLGDKRACEYAPCGLKKGPYEIFSAGRSGGWLIVKGLPPVADWDGPTFQKWRKFARLVSQEMNHLASWDYAKDIIEANEWAPKKGSAAAVAENVRCGESAKLAQVAREVHGILNGREWGADTLEAITDCFTRHGFAVADFEAAP